MKVSLALPCVERCGAVYEMPFPSAITLDDVTSELRKNNWLVSILTPPAQADVVMGPLCPDCARKIYPAQVRALAKWGKGRSK